MKPYLSPRNYPHTGYPQGLQHYHKTTFYINVDWKAVACLVGGALIVTIMFYSMRPI